MTPATRNRHYMQLCWVVPDLESTIGHWVRTAGAGPFFVFGDLHFDDGRYRGAPADVQPCRATIGQLGDMQIELIQPLDEEPSVYKELLDRSGPGFHHLGVASEDIDADVARYEKDGWTLAFRAGVGNGEVAYLDGGPARPGMIELIEASPGLDASFTAMWRASLDWDGTDPLRPR
jgi:hypothetical protein